MAAILLVSLPAMAESSAVTVEDLRGESSQIRQMAREYVTFCRDTLGRASSGRAGGQCAEKLKLLGGVVRSPRVAQKIKELGDAQFDVGLAGLMRWQDGLAKAKEAMPVYLDFLSVISEADIPDAVSKKGKGKK